MDPHPLANLFKRSNYVEPIASELSALDYLYGVLLEMRESENRDEEIYEVIHEGSLNEKHVADSSKKLRLMQQKCRPRRCRSHLL